MQLGLLLFHGLSARCLCILCVSKEHFEVSVGSQPDVLHLHNTLKNEMLELNRIVLSPQGGKRVFGLTCNTNQTMNSSVFIPFVTNGYTVAQILDIMLACPCIKLHSHTHTHTHIKVSNELPLRLLPQSA